MNRYPVATVGYGVFNGRKLRCSVIGHYEGGYVCFIHDTGEYKTAPHEHFDPIYPSEMNWGNGFLVMDKRMVGIGGLWVKGEPEEIRAKEKPDTPKPKEPESFSIMGKEANTNKPKEIHSHEIQEVRVDENWDLWIKFKGETEELKICEVEFSTSPPRSITETRIDKLEEAVRRLKRKIRAMG